MSIGFLLGILGLFTFFTAVTFGSLYFHQLAEKEKQAQAQAYLINNPAISNCAWSISSHNAE